MAPGRVDKFLYVAIVSVLAIMPGMMTLLPPAIKHFMGTKDIGLKFGLVLTGEVSLEIRNVFLSNLLNFEVSGFCGSKNFY